VRPRQEAAAESGSSVGLNTGDSQPPEQLPHDDGGSEAGANDAPPPESRPRDLARELTGDLPCYACGYNLRSISVLGVCPECGTPVRATILARVDPYAGVLRPIDRPRLTAAGLLLWSVAALAAAIIVWSLRLIDAVQVMALGSADAGRLVVGAAVMIALSGLGAAVALVRPHGGIPARQVLAALAGVLAYLPLLYLYWQLHAVYDPPRIAPYLERFEPDRTRALLRLGSAGAMLVIVAGLRPNLRLLTSRSLLMRMGRVDRQTMFALAAAILVAAAGDLLHLLAPQLSPQAAAFAFILGMLLIALGSMLLTVGLVGIVIDSRRIVPVILRPPVSYRQVLGGSDGPAGAAEKP
jgi:hypothetical protein